MLSAGHKMQNQVITKCLLCNRVGFMRLVVFTVACRPPLVTKKRNAGVPTYLYGVHIAHTRFNKKVVSINIIPLETGRQKPQKIAEVANTTDSTSSKSVPLNVLKMLSRSQENAKRSENRIGPSL